jgi:hypothetical protein
MTSTWDNNGACVECGYTPFQLTEFCSQCNPTKISKFNENEKIKNIEEGLIEHGVQYLFMKDLIGMPIIYQDDYDDLDKYLRTYKHVNYDTSPFSEEKEFDSEKQLVIRVKEFLKKRIEYNSIEEVDEFEDVKEEEISYCIDNKPEIENEIPYIRLRNQEWKKVQEIDEDTSSYDEMFEALEAHNKNCSNESIHYLEDQIYRRFIKDIANKKLNINEIINLSDRIKKTIIDPNDGAWESCRWYA